MPPKGFKNLTIREDLYMKLQRLLVEHNHRAGYMKFRSIQQLLEYLIEKEMKELGLA